MSGKYIQGKIHHTSPIYNFLTKGDWKNGFSGIRRMGGNRSIFEVNAGSKILEEGKWYKFELIDEIAHIL